MNSNTRMPAVAALLLLGLAGSAAAQGVPAAQDVPYPGTVRLEVDATDVDHRVFHVREELPVEGGQPLVLLYPRWLPGNHSTTGPVELLAGLMVTALPDGRRLEWRRDPEAMHAFHVDVPSGATSLELRFQYVTPTDDSQGRRMITPDLLRVHWEKNLLYPAGYFARRIAFEPAVTLPPGWSYASALDGGRRDGDTVRFARVALDHLADSPLYAGRHYRRYELDPDPRAPVHLDVFAERPSELDATRGQLDAHRRMVRETVALFGSRHYAHYDFLLAISDNLTGIGLEHHQSSENGVGTGYFSDWEGTASDRDLLPHEFEHSWNGKFRRPADLWTPGFEVPMHGQLLWVYEGMTEFWGVVLAARSGLWSPEFTLGVLAQYAATYDQARQGRAWRNLADTTNQPILAYSAAQSYPSWQRGKDYYTEGLLLWLDVDTRIRELTRGRRSLDDFARSFFGVQDGELGPVAYTLEDVVRELNGVVASDWATFLRERVHGHGPGAPLGGFERGGWQLTYADAPTRTGSAVEQSAKQSSFTFSLGLTVANADGRIKDVVWGSPAFKAGLAPGMTLLAVNGRAWSESVLKEAITAAKSPSTATIDLLVRSFDTFQTARVEYHDGLRYPRLERIKGTEDRLSALLRPITR